MFSGEMNLATFIIGFGMSATFMVFLCTRLICGRLRRVESRQMYEIEPRLDFGMPEYRISGLEPVVVAAIPTMKFNREAFSTMEDAQCSICLGEYQERDVLRIIPKCNHSFHLSCIYVWLRRQPTCPVCRLPVQDLSENEHVQPATHSSEAQSRDSSGISVEHSRSWMLPSAEHSDAVVTTTLPESLVAVNLNAGVSGQAAARL